MREHIPSPFPDMGDEVEYVHAKLPLALFNDLFRKLLPGVDGARQSLVQTFFKALYEQCKLDGIITDGIPISWDPSNVPRIIAIVERLNFNPAGTSPSIGVGPKRPVRAGCTDPRPAEPAAQSKARHGKRTRVTDAGAKVAEPRDQRTDPECED